MKNKCNFFGYFGGTLCIKKHQIHWSKKPISLKETSKTIQCVHAEGHAILAAKMRLEMAIYMQKVNKEEKKIRDHRSKRCSKKQDFINHLKNVVNKSIFSKGNDFSL